MKKTGLLLFLLISFIFKCQSQTFELPENLKSYYQYINFAEEKLIIGKDKEASEYYEKAFAAFDKPFSSDLYNSFLINLKLNNNKSIHDYNRLKCLGINFENLKSSESFHLFLKNNKNLIALHKCNNTIDLALKARLDSLYIKDQKYRIGTNKKEVKKQDSLNARMLNEIFSQKGFIGEYEIGAEQPHKTNVFLKYLIIVLHQQQYNEDRTVNFEPILYQALKEGRIKNKNFVHIIDGLHTRISKYDYFPFFQIEGQCCFISKSIYEANRSNEEKKKIEEIEINRIQIGLNTLNNEVLVRLFSYNNYEYTIEPSYINRFENNSGFISTLKAQTVKINFKDFSNFLNKEK
ncbi:hypothetical protein MUU74_15195 [Chryseobacterium daecheongense]|uniref:hypothetical protein n=1 Tax=Chryseobacterium daecheongense TaxID=192389 RepID=UPI001FD6416D|nr:hypothetical protein [Chryseobacterium daecheongense]UOU97829.1 hypothetical protein MUU74_15195 [Chryseobacterium daecheongense]